MAASVTYTTWQGQIISEDRGGIERDYIPDPLGNTIALVDSNHAVTDTWNYWPYGEVQAHGGPSSTPLSYLGTLGFFTDYSNSLAWGDWHLRCDLTRWLSVDLAWPDTAEYVLLWAHPQYLAAVATPAGGLCSLACPKGSYYHDTCAKDIWSWTYIYNCRSTGYDIRCIGPCASFSSLTQVNLPSTCDPCKKIGGRLVGCQHTVSHGQGTTTAHIPPPEDCDCDCNIKAGQSQNTCCCCLPLKKGGGGSTTL